LREKSSMSGDLIRAAALLAFCAGAAPGCGEEIERPETFPVQGRVTYQGKPVPRGTITFQSDDGQAAVGEIQPDGSYRLSTFEEGDGAVLGHHKVYIIADTSDPGMIPGSSPGYTPPKDLIPKKYNRVETSGLEANVAEEAGMIDFDLD
jgi:hypothetical protein